MPRLSVEQLEDRTTPSATLVLSGAQTIVPGANINVSNNDTTTESEMLIAVNPANPLNVAGFVHSATNLNDIQLFFSSNGGTTWTRRLITSTSGAGLINDGFGAGSRFDPSIAFDRLGNLYVAYGHNTGPGGSSRLVVGSSADGGATFARFTVIDVQANVTFVDSNGQTKTLPGVDKWHLATGLDPSTGNQAVYIAYGQIVMEGTDIDQRITVSGSNNAGATFTPPLTIADDAIAGIGRGLFAHPGVGPNGELYVSWGSGGIRFDRDLDGLFATNSTFGTDTTIITPQPFGPDPLPVQPRRGTGNNPVLAVYQGGGSLSGRIYMAYVDMFNEFPNTDIILASSADRGANWTFAVVDSSAGTEFLPWVTVDQTTAGVHVAYYTTDGAPNNTEVNLRLASSFDGGINFTRANVSTQRSSAPASNYVGDFLEYIGLAVHQGTAHAFWADNRGASQGTFVGDLDSFTASASFRSATGGNHLVVSGDDFGPFADQILVRRSPVNPAYLEVYVNQQLQFAGLFATLDRITINGLAGNDTVILDYANGSVTPAGGLTVNGGADRDTMQIFATNGADNIAIASSFVIVGSGANSYAELESLEVGAGAGNDNIGVETTAATTPVLINAGSGGDTISISSFTNNLDDIDGHVTVIGEGDVDSLILQDQLNGFADAFTISSNTATRPFFGGLTYSGVEFATLNAGAGASRFDVQATPAGTLWIVNAGAGNDAINLGTGGFKLFALLGGVSVNGQGDTDTVTLMDDTVTVSNTYSITDSSVDRGSFGGLDYGTIERLTLNAGNADDTINVLETAAGTPVTVNAGGGNDNVVVGANFFGLRTLNSIQGPLTVNGQGGTADTLSLRDDNTSAAQSYTMTSFSVARSGAALIEYGTMESVVLNATGFSDSINVQSTAAGARVTINALAGNDVTVLGAPTAALLKTVNFIASLVTLNAGAGSDTLTVDDTGDPTNNTGTVSISGVQGFGMAQGVSHSQTESIRIFTSSGNDFVKNSVPFGSGIAVFIDLDGGEDGVVFDGTAGNDRIRIRREVGPEGARAIAEINGQLFVNDYLNGEIVVVHAGAGNDHVVMDDTAAFRWSADFLGEDGNDHLVGNAQNDRLDGGQGNDILEGLAGDDVLVGGPGVDLFIGGDGADQIFAADGDLDVIFADIADVLLSIDRKDRVIRR